LANLLEAALKDFDRLQDDCDAYGHDLAVLKEICKKNLFHQQGHGTSLMQSPFLKKISLLANT
jgi:hypothetical protein